MEYRGRFILVEEYLGTVHTSDEVPGIAKGTDYRVRNSAGVVYVADVDGIGTSYADNPFKALKGAKKLVDDALDTVLD